MKLLGVLLLTSGWLIVLAALILLAKMPEQLAFMAAGVAVECVGGALLAVAYKSEQKGEA